MPRLPESTDLNEWHRYFAIETNNRAWELASQRSRTAAEADEMLFAANASAYHWDIVGADLNRARAKYLVAEVCALSGFAEKSHVLIEEAISFFADHEIDDWEQAYLYIIHAHAMTMRTDS